MPHIHSRASFAAGWRVFGASHQGLDHQDRALPCQDAFEYGTVGTLTWIAVADGLSGERHSDFGAQLAVSYVSAMVRNAFPPRPHQTKDDIREIFEGCRKELFRQADLISRDVRELSTTLQLALWDTNDKLLHYAVIGDGSCIISLHTGECFVVADHRARPSIGTAHLLHEGIEKYMHVESIPLDLVDGVFVFTDGLDRLFLQRRTAENIGKRVNVADIVALKEAMFEVEDETRGVFVLNTVVAAQQNRVLADDKTLVAAIRSANEFPSVVPSIAAIAFDDRLRPLGNSAEETDDTSSTAELSSADSSARLGNLLLRFHNSAREVWLPWLQLLFLMSILAILLAGKIHLPLDISSIFFGVPESSNFEIMPQYP